MWISPVFPWIPLSVPGQVGSATYVWLSISGFSSGLRHLLSLSLFFMTLTVLWSTGQVPYRIFPSCMYLMFSPWLDWSYAILKKIAHWWNSLFIAFYQFSSVQSLSRVWLFVTPSTATSIHIRAYLTAPWHHWEGEPSLVRVVSTRSHYCTFALLYSVFWR